MPCKNCTHSSHSGEGLLIGAAIGTVLGMLFARRSGTDLRKNLSRAGEKEGMMGAASVLGSELKDAAMDAAAAAREAAESEAAQDAIARGKDAITKFTEQGRAFLDRIGEDDEPTKRPPRKAPPKK